MPQPGPKLGVGRYTNVAMPERMYRSLPGINQSALSAFAQSPLHYMTVRQNPQPPTPAMALGSAFHSLVLEPQTFYGSYIQDKFEGSYSAKAKEWRRECLEGGQTPLKTRSGDSIWEMSDWDKIHRMRDAVLEHPVAEPLLDGEKEISMWWKDAIGATDALCKGRVDCYNQDANLIVDLKTSRNASKSAFRQSVGKFHYDIQSAFYLDGWETSGGDLAKRPDGFAFVVVEKSPPFGVSVYILDDMWIDHARADYINLLQAHEKCVREDYWPGYPNDFQELKMPNYRSRLEIGDTTYGEYDY